MGSLEVITGPMGCGKTEELMRRLRRAEIAKREIRLYKPKLDTRDGSHLSASRNGLSWPAIPLMFPTHMLVDINTSGVSRGAVIGIEEAQFFNKNIVEVVKTLVIWGSRVIISGLNTDFKGEPFGSMPELMALADSVTTLSAICMRCGSENATRTQRLIGGSPAPYDSVLVQIGGDEHYEARCRQCHVVPRPC